MSTWGGVKDLVLQLTGVSDPTATALASLPQPMHGHCAVAVDADTLFVAGSNAVFAYDRASGTWDSRPAMQHERIHHACGVVLSPEGLEIVAAGGYATR